MLTIQESLFPWSIHFSLREPSSRLNWHHNVESVSEAGRRNELNSVFNAKLVDRAMHEVAARSTIKDIEIPDNEEIVHRK